MAIYVANNGQLQTIKGIYYADNINAILEEHEWLRSDGDCYIDTLQLYKPYEDSFDMTISDNLYPNRTQKYNKYGVEERIAGLGTYRIDELQENFAVYINLNVYYTVSLLSRTSEYNTWSPYQFKLCKSANPRNIQISKVNSQNKYTVSSQTDNSTNTYSTYNSLNEYFIHSRTLHLFNTDNPLNSFFNGKFAHYIHYRNDVPILNLHPVRLTATMPKNHTWDNQPHYAGECGMWDMVNKKFYGNANTVGTFTVED